ncbi:sensor histidine kinase [Thermomonospora echinospora]|uniref:sensor histidine kinase n=1 Tax=Thermomonospora echinospora TaxID=1992 RepID=UPI00135687A6|nr:nitrate- and nitrite sensing domain-containing protein [Thermomonospora echinospora]
MIPLASLVGLWVFVTMITFGEARELRDARRFENRLVRPSMALLDSLQHERRMSMAYLGSRTLDRSGLDAQRVKTDQARRSFAAAVADPGIRADVDAEVRRRSATVTTALGELDTLRTTVDQRQARRERVLTAYSTIVDGIHDSLQAMTVSNGRLARDLENLQRLGRARELLTREDALVTGLLAAGRWEEQELDEFERINGAKNFMIAETVPGLPAGERGDYERFLAGPDYTRLLRLEEQLLLADETVRRPSFDQGTWHTAAETVIGRMAELELRVVSDSSERSNDAALQTYGRLAAAAGLGLLAIIASTTVAWRISRRLIGESRRVSRAVSQFTQEYLPELAEQVREGRILEPEEALPRQELRVTEIARISDAFTEAGRTVIEAAARESRTRRGINEVFVTLARRNQALVHRQLSLLDTMERRTEDPAELDDLFRLDHLATRMRRHAEGLVILAGRTAGRTWRNPVPLVDVVRGAVAEVEDYTRVGVLSMPAAALAGNAVADTIHLLAELIENATLFSPPASPVRITGQLVPNGFVVEIEDRGLGLKTETLEEINRRLADPPEFDLSDLGRLGLFVVARLAERHHIKVSLRSSPYGGTTAIVLVPADLIVESPSGALPPAELRAQLPGHAPARVVPQAEPAPAARAVAAPPRPVPEVGPARLEKTRPQAAGGDAGKAPTELPRRRRRTTDKTTGPMVAVVPPETGPPDGPVNGSSNGAVNGTAAPVEMTPDGLPRRRRQENLAARLREDTGPQQASGVVGAQPGEDGRAADPDGQLEVVRTKMAAMQRGWQRGRAEAEEGQGTQEDGQ